MGAALGLIAIIGWWWLRTNDAAAAMQGEWLNLWSTPTPAVPAPPELAASLSIEYGTYQSLIPSKDFLTQLQAARVVCIGEAHYEPRDMQTAFELARVLAKQHPVALAVERLSHAMQPQLDSLPTLPVDEARLAVLKTLLQNDDYQRVWGARPKDRSGYPTNTPSQPVFEAMVAWAAQNRVPLIGLDVTWAERGRGLGEDAAYRTALWLDGLHTFQASQHGAMPQIVLVAGISHCTDVPDTIAMRLKADPTFQSVVSIGQRDAMYGYLASAKVASLAKIYGIADVIVRQPQRAVVSSKGVAEFPMPPNYWIAVHTPDTWE